MVEEFRLMNEKSAKRLYPPVKQLPEGQQKRILVTGGAGFVGSHLVDVLMTRGEKVYVLDNLFTGRFENIEHWDGHPNFRFFQHDVTLPFFLEVDQIYHLACPASPPHYQYNPIKTIKTSTHGTLNMLGLAKRVNARLLFTSTSEVYGDPEQHPQRESYRGNVNTMGPRACYDEGKRVGETLCYSYQNQEGVEVRIARIFNTAGPRMSATDGRVVSNFILQSIENKPITVYGRGDQTRSFQYVSDLVRGLYMLMNSDYSKPINLGNPDEYTIGSFAEKIRGMVGSSTPITHEPPKLDDPQKRKPDITTALCILGWEPLVSVDDGMSKTIDYFKSVAGVTQARTDPLWMTDAILEATAEQQAAIKAKQKEKCPSWRDSQQSEL
jgi:UDP-glucuronate decarboxylase